MATQKEIEATYDYMDEIFRESIGTNADISCAMYNGNFNLSLEQAQKAKHEYILNGIHFKKGDRVLDIGCGWGPLLKTIKENEGQGVGVTLSPAQAQTCMKSGFEALVKDVKEIDAAKFGKFDAIASLGCFEHLCSTEEMLAGRQDEVYDRFFKLCKDLLNPGGRMYLQTMTWGKKIPKAIDIDLAAPKLSDPWVLGHIEKYYPGSWLPNGHKHIEKCAEPYFKLISQNDGRLDYAQTLKEFGLKASKFSFKKVIAALKILPRYFSDKDFRYQIASFRNSCNRLCFERDIMRLQRLVFEMQ